MPRPPAFVGRRHELAAMEGLLESTTDGRGETVLLTGTAGIGKSVLLGQLVARCERRAVGCVQATATEYERGRPLGLLCDLLPDPGGELSRLAEAEPLTSPAWLGAHPTVPERVLDVAADVVEAIAAAPTVLVADDVQWADPWSIQALRRLAALVTGRPVLLVVAVRTPVTDVEVLRLIGQLVRSGARRIELGPLTPDDVSSLATAWLGSAPGLRLRRLLERAQGHPLYLVELLRGVGRGPDAATGGPGELDLDSLPDTVTDAVRWRLDALAPEELAALRHAALLGSRFPVDDLVLAMQSDLVTTGELISRLGRAGVLSSRGDHVEFSHDVVREVIEKETPEAVRRALHRQLADVLAGQGRPEVVVAHHLARGSARGERAAVERVVAAAEATAPRDPAGALELLDLVLPEVEDDDLRHRVQRVRAEPLAWVGRVDEAIALARSLLDSLPDAEARAELRWLLAGLLVARNRGEEAEAELDVALEETGDPLRRARMLAEGALARLATGRNDAARTMAERAADESGEVGDALAGSLACSVGSRLAAYDHEYDEAGELARSAVELAEADRSAYAHRMAPWFFAGLVALDADDDPGAERAVRAGLARADELATDWARPLYSGLAASLALKQGRLDDASVQARTGVDLAHETGSVAAIAWCHAIEAAVALHRGEVDAAHAELTEGERYFASGRALLGYDFLHRGRALVLARRGDVPAAVDTLWSAWELTAQLGIGPCRPVLAPDLVVLAEAAGEHRLASRVSSTLAADARTGVPSLVAVAAWCQGIVEREPATLATAVALLDGAGRPLDAALAGADWMAVLSLRGRMEELAAHAPGVVERLHRFDLPVARDRVIALLGAEGAGSATGPTGGADPWERLTPTERAVAALVGAGRSNAQIARDRQVSVRTVETHLHRVYSKLGIPSRTQLAVEAARRSDLAGDQSGASPGSSDAPASSATAGSSGGGSSPPT